jgi:hypothetical protein
MSWPKKGKKGVNQSQEFTLLDNYHPFFFLNAWTLPLLALTLLHQIRSGRLILIPQQPWQI